MIGKFLLWLQERIKYWIKPATPVLVSGVLSALSRSRIDLVVENALLRQQLIVLKRQVKRPQLTDPERFRLVFLSPFTKFWKRSLHMVQPETLLAVEVARQVKDFIGNDQAHPPAGQGESIMGSRTHPR
jgi:hypothetical protein